MARDDERLSLTLPSELKEQFSQIAKKNHRSLIQEATVAIENHVKSETGEVSDEEFEAKIERVLKRMIEEKKMKGEVKEGKQ